MAVCHPVAEKHVLEQQAVVAAPQQKVIRRPTANTLLARIGAALNLSTVVLTK